MKTIIIRAKVAHDKRTYRDIELPHNDTCYKLAKAILDSFNFEMEHLFGFGNNPRNYYQSVEQITYQPYGENDPFAKMFGEENEANVEKIKISDVYFFQQIKDKMSFLFDYGDDWMFEIELRSFGEKEKGVKYPRVLKSNGEAPKQYRDDY